MHLIEEKPGKDKTTFLIVFLEVSFVVELSRWGGVSLVESVSLLNCHPVVDRLPCLVFHMTEVISDLLNVT